MESDTPRTDALVEADGLRRLIVARELERELAAAKAQLATNADELAAMREQRDEARRELCEMIARTRRKTGIRGQIVGLDRVTPAEIAVERGWEGLFKEGGGA
jgi:hypothetical protein